MVHKFWGPKFRNSDRRGTKCNFKNLKKKTINIKTSEDETIILEICGIKFCGSKFKIYERRGIEV